MLTKASEAVSIPWSRDLAAPVKTHLKADIISSKVQQRFELFFSVTLKMFKSFISARRPHKSSARADTSPSWQALYMIVLCRQTNVDYNALFAPIEWSFHSVKAARQGVTMAWSGKENNQPADRRTRPTYTPLFSLAADIVDGLKDWVGWDPRSTFCSIRHVAHDRGGHKGRETTKCCVGAGRHPDFPWRSRDPFYSFLWC